MFLSNHTGNFCGSRTDKQFRIWDADLGLPPATMTDLNGSRQSAINNQKPKTSQRNIVIVCVVLALFVGALFLLAYQFDRPQPQPVLTNTAPRSIAVLPFKNLTGDAEKEIFTDGMTESLISSLSKIENLKVISRNSVLHQRTKDVDPRESTKKLNVASVLEGSVRENDNNNPRRSPLVNNAKRRNYLERRGLLNVRPTMFEIQDEICPERYGKSQIKTDSNRRAAIDAKTTSSVAVYQAYLKGLHYHNQWIWRRRSSLQEALRLEPDYRAGARRLGQSSIL